MRLSKLMDTVLQLDQTLWHKPSTLRGRREPTYRYAGAAANGADVASHEYVATYMPDVSITLAWGMVVEAPYRADWANKFSREPPTVDIADVFYCGALVFRVEYVTVDGRMHLPMPVDGDGQAMTAPDKYAYFVRMLNDLEGGFAKQFDSYMNSAGITVTGERWPVGLI